MFVKGLQQGFSSQFSVLSSQAGLQTAAWEELSKNITLRIALR
jgi:hypothetical protein